MKTVKKEMSGVIFNLRPYPHPGKYESGYVIDELLDNPDYFDEECSTEYGGFHYGLIRGGFTAEDLAKHPTLTADEAAFLSAIEGAVVLTTQQGFVYVEYFASKAALEQHFAKAREYVATFGDA